MPGSSQHDDQKPDQSADDFIAEFNQWKDSSAEDNEDDLFSESNSKIGRGRKKKGSQLKTSSNNLIKENLTIQSINDSSNPGELNVAVQELETNGHELTHSIESVPRSSSKAPQPNSSTSDIEINEKSNEPSNPVIEIDASDATKIAKSDVKSPQRSQATPQVAKSDVPPPSNPPIVENGKVVASPSALSNSSDTKNFDPLPSNSPIVEQAQIPASASKQKTVILIETSDDSSSECSSYHHNHGENDDESGLEEDEPEYEIEVKCTDENALISSVFGSDYQTGYQVASLKYKERELICRCGMEFICVLKKTTNKHIVFLQILKSSEKYDENLVVVMAQGREVRDWLKKTG